MVTLTTVPCFQHGYRDGFSLAIALRAAVLHGKAFLAARMTSMETDAIVAVFERDDVAAG